MQRMTVLFSIFMATTLGHLSNYPTHCPPIAGNLTVKLGNIWPESVDYYPPSCKIYVGSLNNNSIVEFDPYTSTSRVIEFPDISHNFEYFICGIDYSPATESLYVSANARAPWWNPGSDAMGKNLTGPNRLIRYSPLNHSIVWEADVNPLVDEIETEIGTKIGGFQDQAEDKDGNAYFPSAWGNVIIKADKHGGLSKFYVPGPDRLNTSGYGFGALAMTENNVLILPDALSHTFATFDLSGPNPSVPTYTRPANLPANYSTALFCDSLILPKRFYGKIALCADVFDTTISSHGIIAVYTSEDGWRTSKWVGPVPAKYDQAPAAWTTATFEAEGRIYALTSVLPYETGKFPVTNSTPLIDITDRVDKLVAQQGLLHLINGHE